MCMASRSAKLCPRTILEWDVCRSGYARMRRHGYDNYYHVKTIGRGLPQRKAQNQERRRGVVVSCSSLLEKELRGKSS